MKLKKIIVITMVIAGILLMRTSTLALGAKKPNIDESKIVDIITRWNNTQTVSFGLNRTTGDCSVRISGTDSVTKITGTLTLYKLTSSGSYSYVKSWSSTTYSDYLLIQGSGTFESRISYKLAVDAKVYVGASYESVYKDQIFNE